MTHETIASIPDPEENLRSSGGKKPLAPGDFLGTRYVARKRLGRGGMGEVWLADEMDGGEKVQDVVVKIVPPEVQASAAEMAKIRQSFEIVRRLRHPNICSALTVGTDERYGVFLVMDYVAGESLSAYQADQVGGVFTLEEMLEILAPLAAALDFAHEQRILHRDIKPENIMVPFQANSTRHKEVKLIDFGLAAEMQMSMTSVSRHVVRGASGTLPYMPPEQVNSEEQTPRSDQYSLAVTAYEMLTGRRPFRSPDVSVLIHQITTKPIPPILGVPEHVNAAISRAAAKERKERFESCAEFVAAMKKPAPPIVKTSALPPPPPLSSRKRAGDRATLTAKGVEYAFRWCPEGTFMMGSPMSESGRDDNELQYQVTLTRGFWMQETQVTRAMWEIVMESDPSRFWGSKKLPVECVSWNDCQEYIMKLNSLKGIPAGYKFSLPTEAQWEYACRAGTTTPYHFGSALNGDKANCNGNYPYGTSAQGNYLEKTTEVGSYLPNVWGLLDMHGNVWEWCQDWFGDYPRGSVTDTAGPTTGVACVLRGGSWDSFAGSCRSASRNDDDPGTRAIRVGLRLVLVREN